MAAKQYKAKRGISLSSQKEDESDIKDNMDLDQIDDKYLL